MFAAVFQALMRVANMTIVPALLAIGIFLIEWGLKGASWLIVAAADLFGKALQWCLNLVPIPPDLDLYDIPFANEFLGLLTAAGFWNALQTYISGSILIVLIRIITFGYVGKR